MSEDRTSELMFLNMSLSQVTIENVNRLNSILHIDGYDISIFDNTDVERYEHNMAAWDNKRRLTTSLDVEIYYNNIEQLFKRPPHRSEPSDIYDYERFDKTIEYVLSNTERDIIVTIGDKIILNTIPVFDKENIWVGSMGADNNNLFGYVNMFNIGLMRKHGLQYHSFASFIRDIVGLKYTIIKPDMFGMVLPADFDKYNGRIFRVGGVQKKLMFDYFIDKYGHRFGSYEDEY